MAANAMRSSPSIKAKLESDRQYRGSGILYPKDKDKDAHTSAFASKLKLTGQKDIFEGISQPPQAKYITDKQNYDSIDKTLEKKYHQMMMMQKDRQHIIKLLHDKNSTTIQNALKHVNYDTMDHPKPSPKKTHFQPIQTIKPALPPPKRANNFMPKKPADTWEHEFGDLRLGGF